MFTYPSFLWDDGPRDNLEVMHVEDVVQRWTSGKRGLPRLLLLRDLLDSLHDRAGIDGTEAKVVLSRLGADRSS